MLVVAVDRQRVGCVRLQLEGMGAAESILKLEFDLTQRVLLRAQTGETNAVGVFYRYSFD